MRAGRGGCWGSGGGGFWASTEGARATRDVELRRQRLGVVSWWLGVGWSGHGERELCFIEDDVA